MTALTGACLKRDGTPFLTLRALQAPGERIFGHDKETLFVLRTSYRQSDTDGPIETLRPADRLDAFPR